jgi:uroporphyrinogen III methyltransferase / synthase
VQNGTIYLVGAGPGDPGLITVRGLDLVRACDALVYDRLVVPELVEQAPPYAERFFVGKRRGGGIPQGEISDLLVSLAERGLRVVRLKGGDPFVLGRGGEEAQALAAAGIGFEVVPGISSAASVPAYAGIPVTHRGVASAFAVVSGHGRTDWGAYASFPGTLVLLMGIGDLATTTARLMEAGRDPTETAAAIEWGTTARQRTIVGDLASIAELVEVAGVGAPATVVIGDVVALRDEIDWFQGVRDSSARTGSGFLPH